MKIICFGDSNTYGYDPASLFGENYPPESRWVDLLGVQTGWQVINQGVNGREIPTGQVSFPEDTDLAIIMLGTNDLLQFSFAEDAAARMEAFLKTLTLDRDRILVIAPPPMVFGAWVEDQELIDDSANLAVYYEDICSRLGIRFADAGKWGVSLGHDGVHFTQDGHRAFANGLLAFLQIERK